MEKQNFKGLVAVEESNDVKSTFIHRATIERQKTVRIEF